MSAGSPEAPETGAPGVTLPPFWNLPDSSESNVSIPLGAPAPVAVGSTGPRGPDAGAAGAADAGPTVPAPDCGLGVFQAPERVTGLDPNRDLWAPSLSADALTLYLAASEEGGAEQIFYATRSDRGSAFSPLIPVVGVNSDAAEGTPLPSSDGLTLYFYSTREGGLGDRDLWFATRADVTGEFGDPSPLAGMNSSGIDHLPWLSADERVLFFVSTRAGGVGQSDVWGATRASRTESFVSPVPLSSINTPADQGRAVLSSDLLTLVFASAEATGLGSQDLWVDTRETLDAPFSAASARNLTELNSSGRDVDPSLSADDRELFFSSDRDGRSQIWRSVRACE